MGVDQSRNIHKWKYKLIKLKNMFYIPDIAYNLISISQERENGFRAILVTHGDDPKIGRLELLHKNTNDVNMVGEEVIGLYHAAIGVFKDNANVVTESKNGFWHERLGYCAYRTLKSTVTYQNESMCRACMIAKITRSPRKSSTKLLSRKVTTRAVERFYTDVVSPIKVQ